MESMAFSNEGIDSIDFSFLDREYMWGWGWAEEKGEGKS